MVEEQLVQNLEFLSRSHVRFLLLKHVDRHGPLTSREIREQMEYSRTTVQRNLDKLVQRGWLHLQNRRYTVTPCGRKLATQLVDTIEVLRLTRTLSPALQWLPADDLDLDIAYLSDADITLSTQGDPYAVVNAHVAAIKSTTKLEALLPSIGREALAVMAERVDTSDAECEVVVAADCAQTLTNNPHYTSLFEKIISTPACEAHVYEDGFPYFIGILDDSHVQLGIEDSEGVPRALIETTSDDVLDWAKTKFNTYRQRATPLTIQGY